MTVEIESEKLGLLVFAVSSQAQVVEDEEVRVFEAAGRVTAQVLELARAFGGEWKFSVTVKP